MHGDVCDGRRRARIVHVAGADDEAAGVDVLELNSHAVNGPVEELGALAEEIWLAVFVDQVMGLPDVFGVDGAEGSINADGDGGVPGCESQGTASLRDKRDRELLFARGLVDGETDVVSSVCADRGGEHLPAHDHGASSLGNVLFSRFLGCKLGIVLMGEVLGQEFDVPAVREAGIVVCFDGLHSVEAGVFEAEHELPTETLRVGEVV